MNGIVHANIRLRSSMYTAGEVVVVEDEARLRRPSDIGWLPPPNGRRAKWIDVTDAAAHIGGWIVSCGLQT